MNGQGNQQQPDRNAAQSAHQSLSATPLHENGEAHSAVSQPTAVAALPIGNGVHLSVLA
jgi:hypothetical protein